MLMEQEEIFNVPVPEKTETYSPVSHQHIVEEIQENIDKTNLIINNIDYRAANKGEEVVGYMDLIADSVEFNYRIAFQNSYNKSRPIAFVGGTSVMICSNGMIVGETQFVRRHTGTVIQELDEKIKHVLGDLERDLIIAEKHSKQMKQIELNETATAELCGRFLMEQEIITSSQLSIIRHQLKNPDHAVFADPNLWSLYNHTTHALKKTHPYNYLDSYTKLHQFVEKEFQLV